MFSPYGSVFLTFFSLLSVSLFAQTGTVSGRVSDVRTGETLIGATVQVEGTSLGGVSDIDGNFRIANVPVGSYNLTAAYIGYTSQTKFNIVIRSEGNPPVLFSLREEVNELSEVVIMPNPFEKDELTPLSIQKFSQEEIASYPGGNNDIAKVVQSFPGVSGSVGGFRNDVIIRGGAPNENVYYLDGIQIPGINHFSTQGSAGGPVGLLNVSFFESVTLSASSFGSQYDNALSGVLQFDQRNGNAEKFTGNFRVGSSEAALTLEGPLGKKDSLNNPTTFIISARRSYLQLLFDAIGLPFLPDYWDFQYKVHKKINDRNEIYLTGVGTLDDLAINALEEYSPEQQAIQDQIPVIRQKSHAGGIGWKHDFESLPGYMQTTLSNSIFSNRFRNYKDNVNETGLIYENVSEEKETRFNQNFFLFPERKTFSFGYFATKSGFSNQFLNQVYGNSFVSELDLYKFGIYTQSSTELPNGRWKLSGGFRMDGNSFTNKGYEIFRTFSPRASLSYRLTADGKWTINSSAGRYFKIPPFTVLGFEDNSGTYENKNTEYIRSDHLVAGVEYLVTKSARLSLESFYKFYGNYPVSRQDSVSLANKGGGFEVLGSEPVASVGKGRTWGLEFLFQQKFSGKFYGVLAVTWYHSEFSDFDSQNFKPAIWDNRWLISTLGGYKFGKNWEVSSRFRFLGRTPYAPVDTDATLQNYPAVIRNYDALGTVRLDPFSQLDLRVDKKWSFQKWSLDLFLDIQNVLAQKQPTEPRFGLNRDSDGMVITPEELVLVPNDTGGSVLPSLGVVVNF